jgi:ATP-dependent DNA helicase RecQ
VNENGNIFDALRRYWGYGEFRPLQEKIVHSLLAGHDTCVVMPTGGGKSLCYQLPAAMLGDRTVLVISPLIALMQDQVAQLSQMGIPAAFLNSTLTEREQSEIVRGGQGGKYRLLYLSPERLVRADTVEWLKKTPLAFFVIDEAHCISEWGHDFRPEYRRLKNLRSDFPKCPIGAFTASATRHVRHDIIEQLGLRNPDKYIASFHRSNLRYIVRETTSRTQGELLLRTLRRHEGESAIVYAPTIKRVGETAAFLQEEGIAALSYHGKMETEARHAAQHRWMSGEVRVLVGTVAFGLGINKADVRAVVHLSLPKSIEQYYQEAGRAGRDGSAADCILLWQKRDAGLLAHFIGQIGDAAEKERAWQRYHTIRRFVDSKTCRHLAVSAHFGETPKWKTCAVCDVCGCATAWIDAAPASKKRDAEHRRGSVVAGGPTTRDAAFGDLRESLRQWRRSEAERQGVPAFVILHDSTIENICAVRPDSIGALRTVQGIGERKAARYGEQILAVVRRTGGSTSPAAPQILSEVARETIRLVRQGRTLGEVAAVRELKTQTIFTMVAKLVEAGTLPYQEHWVDAKKRDLIAEQCSRLGAERLRALKDALPEQITYDEIRLVAAEFRRKRAEASARNVERSIRASES